MHHSIRENYLPQTIHQYLQWIGSMTSTHGKIPGFFQSATYMAGLFIVLTQLELTGLLISCGIVISSLVMAKGIFFSVVHPQHRKKVLSALSETPGILAGHITAFALSQSEINPDTKMQIGILLLLLGALSVAYDVEDYLTHQANPRFARQS